ncbi:MAG: hypothetical protein OEY44_02740 [Candidatus Peregrinibacteria bacterium]|nr:hypothetical protein [Candidatus Peregrinibacteria bacterium]
MKKRFLYVAVFLLTISLLAACGNKRPSLEDRIGQMEDLDQASYEGVVERLPQIDIYEKGTHQLLTDGKTILLQSNKIDLNRYLDEEVRVEGEVVEGIGDARDVFSVTAIEYLDGSLSADQENYKNSSMGFSLEYPSFWDISEIAGALSFRYEESQIVKITVHSSEEDLDGFADTKEVSEGVEVTIGAQRALRYLSGNMMRFYVPNPPKEKIYIITYAPGINPIDDPKGAETERNLFYRMLKSIQLIYLGQLSGDKCGGLEKLECPEEHICQLEDESKYAEGICVPVGGEASAASCPYIAPPSSCEEYRIVEYSLSGCPARFECVVGGESLEPASFRDLNTVDAGTNPEEEVIEEEVREVVEEELVEEIAESEEKSYEVPDVSAVSFEYVNSRRNFSLLMPKTWYYASFGPIDGTLWKVGFADFGLEEAGEAIITLAIEEEAGGSASKKIDPEYFNFYGPADLTEVMEKMADSVETF